MWPRRLCRCGHDRHRIPGPRPAQPAGRYRQASWGGIPRTGDKPSRLPEDGRHRRAIDVRRKHRGRPASVRSIPFSRNVEAAGEGIHASWRGELRIDQWCAGADRTASATASGWQHTPAGWDGNRILTKPGIKWRVTEFARRDASTSQPAAVPNVGGLFCGRSFGPRAQAAGATSSPPAELGRLLFCLCSGAIRCWSSFWSRCSGAASGSSGRRYRAAQRCSHLLWRSTGTVSITHLRVRFSCPGGADLLTKRWRKKFDLRISVGRAASVPRSRPTVHAGGPLS